MYRIRTTILLVIVFLTFGMYTLDAETTYLSVDVRLSTQHASLGDTVDVTVLIKGYENLSSSGLSVVEVFIPINTVIFSYVKESSNNLVDISSNDEAIVTLGYRETSKDIYYSYVDVINPINSDTSLFTFKIKVIADNVNLIEEIKTTNVTVMDKNMNIVPCKFENVDIFITTFNIDDKNNIFSKIYKNTDIKDFKSEFSNNITAKVFKDGQEVIDTTYIGTGMQLKLYISGNEFKEYVIVVTGDVNGDGKINVTDMVLVTAHILNKRELNEIQIIAADTYKDEKINVTDYIRILSDVLDKREIEPY